MPAKLVNTVRVAPAGVFLVQAVAAQVVDGSCLVEGAGGQLLSVAAPIDRVDLGAVSRVLAKFVLLLEPALKRSQLGRLRLENHLGIQTWLKRIINVLKPTSFGSSRENEQSFIFLYFLIQSIVEKKMKDGF